MSQVGIDIVGPLPVTARGNIYSYLSGLFFGLRQSLCQKSQQKKLLNFFTGSCAGIKPPMSIHLIFIQFVPLDLEVLKLMLHALLNEKRDYCVENIDILWKPR